MAVRDNNAKLKVTDTCVATDAEQRADAKTVNADADELEADPDLSPEELDALIGAYSGDVRF